MDLALLTARVLPLWRSSSFFRNELVAAAKKKEPQALGGAGERFAAYFLQQKKFRILRTNFRSRHGGEVDIVCRDRRNRGLNVLVFTEVKTRRSDIWGRPSASVDAKKRKLIFRGAAEWLRLLDNPDVPFRFDIVEVLVEPEPQVTLIENAFQLPDGVLY
ncbi:MAG: YraN family protein [Chthoniobacterales bacterium]